MVKITMEPDNGDNNIKKMLDNLYSEVTNRIVRLEQIRTIEGQSPPQSLQVYRWIREQLKPIKGLFYEEY